MKDILTSPRIQDMKRKRARRRMRVSILVFILIASIVFALAYFSGNPRVSLRTIVVSGTSIINSKDVEARVKSDISGRYLGSFSRSDAFIYPKSFLYRDLYQAFPRIEKLSIYRDNLHTLHIDISERAGKSLYCGSSIPTDPSQVGENCYFINDDGYIFDKAPYFSGNVYFKYYADLAGNSDTLGSQMLPSERFHKLAGFIDSIGHLGFKPIYLLIGQDGDDHLYLEPKPGGTNPEIIWKDGDDLDTIFSNLSLAMSKPEFANEINSKYATLLYIDLRFKDKVLYKFQ